MAFGKRLAVSASVAKAASLPADADVPASRLEKMRDQLLDVMHVAQDIADAVRDEGTVPMPLITDVLDPEAGPLGLKGFSELFVERGRDGLSHRVLAYSTDATDGAVDPNAQYHLQQLTGQILAFNLFCQRAELDGVLGVALQAPDVPRMIDSIIVRSAFFAAVIDNMTTIAGQGKAAPSTASMFRHRENLDRHLLMAQDKMIDPAHVEKMVPHKAWPFYCVEMAVAPHDGDYFINGVYFPADHARLLLAAAPATGSGATASA